MPQPSLGRKPKPFQLRRQDAAVEGLDDIYMRAGLDRPGNLRGIAVGSAENDLRLASECPVLQGAQELKAVQMRHTTIQEHGVRRPLVAFEQRLLPVFG